MNEKREWETGNAKILALTTKGRVMTLAEGKRVKRNMEKKEKGKGNKKRDRRKRKRRMGGVWRR